MTFLNNQFFTPDLLNGHQPPYTFNDMSSYVWDALVPVGVRGPTSQCIVNRNLWWSVPLKQTRMVATQDSISLISLPPRRLVLWSRLRETESGRLAWRIRTNAPSFLQLLGSLATICNADAFVRTAKTSSNFLARVQVPMWVIYNRTVIVI